jgi:competence protein CoiA
MITCKVGDNIINCYDGTYNKEQLKNWATKNILICPVCGNTYSYCHGEFKSPYFRHKVKDKCEDKYSELESNEHINGKCDLYEWIKNQEGVTEANLEGWIPETKQRPDIIFKYNGKQYAIEYQCTPIATEYTERHELYKLVGIKDIWICGIEKYFQYYHKGSGEKRISVIEENGGIYYDSSQKNIYKIDGYMSEKFFKDIIDSKTYVNLMTNPFDYKHNKENFYLIKDRGKSYSNYSYYPSPTGRSSRKYPYPVTSHRYNINVSLAKCEKLKNITMSYLGGVTYR